MINELKAFVKTTLSTSFKMLASGLIGTLAGAFSGFVISYLPVIKDVIADGFIALGLPADALVGVLAAFGLFLGVIFQGKDVPQKLEEEL